LFTAEWFIAVLCGIFRGLTVEHPEKQIFGIILTPWEEKSNCSVHSCRTGPWSLQTDTLWYSSVCAFKEV